ncbi:MAG: hypothetical protein HKN47_01290 [Pirellulaceae bacterium]|nr:hypothetical protein [Pirellulaceae bacterium]
MNNYSANTNDSGTIGSAITDASQTPLWIVCESGQRWLFAIRRFINQLMPADSTASIVTGSADDVGALLVGHRRAVVVWEISPDNLSAACDQIAKVSISSPGVLQIAISNGLSDAAVIALTELGVATTICQVEQLPRLEKLFHLYFAPAV